MDCPASEFANKLVKEKGMKKLREDVNDMIILNGTFAGQSNCNVIIINGKNNTIKGIGVAYPINDSWDITQKRYLKLKSQLTKKYGTPTFEEEYFKGYEPTSDFMRFYQLRNDNAKFETAFDLPEGTIKLQIVSLSDDGGEINLLYVDNINSKYSNQDDLDDL